MRQRELGILALCVIVSVIGTVLLMNNFVITPSTISLTSDNSDTVFFKYHAVVCKKVTRVDGTIEDLGCSKNVFTHGGMNFTSWQLGGTIVGALNRTLANTSVDVIALGSRNYSACYSTALNASELYLCGELNGCGLSRAKADAVRINSTGAPSAGNWTLTKEFTNTCDSVAVNVTGLFNTTTVNQTGQDVFFAQNTFTTATLSANDKINVTWFIWVT